METAEPTVPTPETPTDPPSQPAAGGSRELLGLAAPLILSQSFMTVQVFVDTVLLSWYGTLEMAASFPAVMWYWLGFGLLQVTAGYTSTFVAQYTGAGRPHRVGPAVWQGVHFAVVSGLLFLVVVPLAPFLIGLGAHSPGLQVLEVAYLRCLAFAALPMLVMAAVNGFFSGRGQTWTVLGIEVVGTVVNVALALVMIFGRLGFPEMGIAGAGWSTVAGSWASALVGVGLFLRRRYREEFATATGWRLEPELFGRLMKYGGPAGAQVFLDVLVFLVFTMLVGQLGDAAMGATTLTVRLNMIAFLPLMGLGQAVCILVGQRLGGDRPDLAERTVYTGLRWSFGYMCVVALVYLTMPRLLVSLFQGDRDIENFEAVAAIVPGLLVCVAAYSLVESLNFTFGFALRGAGDTRFVTLVTFCLAWPIMVLPTYLVVQSRGDVNWAWWFATAHIFAMGTCFYLRFRAGKWKSMRVIEPSLEAAA
jgi:MATE family multidrug resistance protein